MRSLRRCRGADLIFPAGFLFKGDKNVLIEVTKLNDSRILINPDAIEYVEETPDTVVLFRSGRKIIIKESRQEIKNLVKLESV